MGIFLRVCQSFCNSLYAISGVRCLRDHIDAQNKHIIRLAEKDVFFGDKKYKYFVMQSTSGGHFPSNYAHAETALNLFQAKTFLIFHPCRVSYMHLTSASCVFF